MIVNEFGEKLIVREVFDFSNLMLGDSCLFKGSWMLASENLSLPGTFSGVSTWLCSWIWRGCTLTQEWFREVAAGSSRIFNGGAVCSSARYDAPLWFSEVVARSRRVFGDTTLTASARYKT